MKTKMQFKLWLKDNDACIEAVKWCNNKTAREVWNTCERGDWLLWWCARQNVSLQLLTLAKGKCAETVVHLMKDPRSKAAVRAAIDFGNGKISRENLDAAAYAAYAAYAAAAAAYAANAAANADAAYAAAAAAAAAYAAANADAAYAAAAALKVNRKLTADIVRSIIKPTWI